MSERRAIATGGCQCGAVRYALYRAPEGSVCHCRMCQKATGGPFGAFAKVPKTDFAWTRGRPAAFRSSSVACRDFCADCGTPLSFRYLDADHIEVTVGSLDHPEAVVPRVNAGVEGRLPWIGELAPGRLPERRTEEGFAQAATLRSRQHPDHDTPDPWQPPPIAV